MNRLAIARRSPSARTALEQLARLPGWWLGAAEARRQLAQQAASDRERDEHHRKIGEYEKKALAEDLARRNGA